MRISTMSNYAKLTSALIGAWFVISLLASAGHLYAPAPGAPPLLFGLAAATPMRVFLLWFTASAEFRRFTMSLDTRILTFVQSWRIAGFIFLVLAAFGILPTIFALPAGWGDIAIGATAPFVALKLS